MRHLPNVITVIRILLIIPIGWLLWRGDYRNALVVMAIAGASDALDGALARRFKWTSRFGAMVDPVADKLLVTVLFVVLMIQGHVPLWLGLIVVVRDVVILLGAGAYRLLFEDIEVAPTFVSKANTAMQFIMLVLVLLALVQLPPFSEIAERLLDPWCFVIVAVLGVTSGVDYVISWSHRAVRRWRENS